MSYLFFVRHGQGTLDGGQYDQLSELGRIQAGMLGKIWVERGFTIDYVCSGTQNRHCQTAELVAAEYQRAGLDFPEIRTDKRFNEIDSLDILEKLLALLLKNDSHFEGLVERTRMAMKKNTPDKIELFDRCMKIVMDTWINNRFPEFDGMTWEDYCRTVLDTKSEFDTYKGDDRIAIFTSGNPIGIYIKATLDLSNAKALEVVGNLYNSNVTSIFLNNGQMALKGLNDVSHLAADQITQK